MMHACMATSVRSQVPCCAAHTALAHLKLAGVDAVVALDERVAEVVDAEFLQSFKRPIVKVEVVGVPAMQQA